MKNYDTYREMLRHSGIDPYMIRSIREEFVYCNRSLADKEWLKTLPKNYDPKFLKYALDPDAGHLMEEDEKLVMSEHLEQRVERLQLNAFISDFWKIVILVTIIAGLNIVFGSR